MSADAPSDPLATLREYRALAPWGLRDLAALAGGILDASGVVPVNAAGGEIEGTPSVTCIRAIDGDVSLAVIAVPCDQVPGVVDDCIAKGVKALLVISAGFGETGGPGREKEAAILDVIDVDGLGAVRPNNPLTSGKHHGVGPDPGPSL